MGSHGSLLAAFHVVLIFLPPLTALVHQHLGRSPQPYRTLLLRHLLFIGVGLQGSAAGLKQLFHGEAVAAYTGWAFSPFVAELGLMNLSYGILGFIATFASRGWQTAAALGYGLFLFGAGIGHILDMMQTGNVSLGNAGPTLWSDLLIPLALAVLLLGTRHSDGKPTKPATRPHHTN